jgi:predicted transcriptional regulator
LQSCLRCEYDTSPMPRNPTQTSNMQNRLWIARNRAGYSQKWVRHLLGKRSLASISEYERGHKLPPLPVALKLELIYQTPLAELFPNLHASVTQEIGRAKKGLLSVELRDAEVQKMRHATLPSNLCPGCASAK